MDLFSRIESAETRIRMLEEEMRAIREIRAKEKQGLSHSGSDGLLEAIDKRISELEESMDRFIQTSHSILFKQNKEIQSAISILLHGESLLLHRAKEQP